MLQNPHDHEWYWFLLFCFDAADIGQHIDDPEGNGRGEIHVESLDFTTPTSNFWDR
jgi:hypothetical protein